MARRHFRRPAGPHLGPGWREWWHTERPSRRAAFVDRVVGWRRDRFAGISGTGTFFAAAFYLGANTPSLLPRPWYLAGAISGICAVVGYVLGLLFGHLVHLFIDWSDLRLQMRPGARRTLIGAWLTVIVLVLLVVPLSNLQAQQLTTQFVGSPPPGLSYVARTAGVAVLVFALFVLVWRLIAGVFDMFLHGVSRLPRLQEGAIRVTAGVLTLVVFGVAFDQGLLRGGLALATRNADAVNATKPAGWRAPASPYKSGGPGSHEAWASLGQDGALFVSGGPTRADIEAATGRSARDPIRVFAGVGDGRSPAAARDAVLAELDRTHAFDRAAIYVVTATSTGFINEWSASAFEYLGGGDTAVVSMQFSTLPSAIALLSDPDGPPEAGRLLFDAVWARIQTLPPGRRPKLYVGGESLGAYGGNGIFASPEDMLARVDGAVWTGTPSFTRVHQEITQRRNPASTEVNPVVENGRHFRFAGRPAELLADQYGRALGPWAYPRVVYLQHRSDPVAWWSPNLLFETPDWLREKRQELPTSQMSWYPVVTFWQVTADMAMSNNVPGGFGHRYFEDETVPAWAAVLGRDPKGDYRAIRARIAAATH